MPGPTKSADSQELTNAEIEQALAANCSENPEMLAIDVVKME